MPLSFRTGVLVLALAGAVLGPVASAGRASEDAERELFRSLGDEDLPESPRWFTPEEAKTRARRQRAQLRSLRLSGFPNPRAEERLAELQALIARRRDDPARAAAPAAKAAAVTPVPAARPVVRTPAPNLVYVCKYLGEEGSQFHRLGCEKLYGIISTVDYRTAVRGFEACPACSAGVSAKVGDKAEDLRAPIKEAEKREEEAQAAAASAEADLNATSSDAEGHQVAVKVEKWEKNDSGFADVKGYAENKGSAPVNVEIEITLVDAAGQAIKTEEYSPSGPDPIPPGDKRPFQTAVQGGDKAASLKIKITSMK